MHSVKKLVSTLNLSKTEWLQYRKRGIGGSDAGAVCGLNPYVSVMDVYLDKINADIVEEKDNEAMKQGRDLEDYVARRFTEETGLKVRKSNAMYMSREHPFMLADVDRLLVGQNAGLECKTASPYSADKWKDGKVPAHYLAQCYHYMAVLGADAWYIAVVIYGRDFKYIKIELKNLSSINRCFYIKMENPLEESDWEFVKKIFDEKYMHYFKIGFVDYLENNYEQVVQNVKTNYGLYQHELKEMKSQSGNSGKRIADTLALLMVTKKVLRDYFVFRNIDNEIILKIDNIIRRNIIEIGEEMNAMLDDMLKKEAHMRYLPLLAKAISDGWYRGYFIAEDEKSYCKNLNKCDGPRKYIGFYSNDGFLSFKPEDMCLLLEDIFEAKKVTMSELAKELRTYSLVHVNNENKNSCRWHTNGKYYHVHIRQLLELTLTHEEVKEYYERKEHFGW